MARSRGRSAHWQRGCVARGCCEEQLGGGLTRRGLSPPRAFAPPAEAAAPPLPGCPPRPGGHRPAPGASWTGLDIPPPVLSTLSGSAGAAAGGQGGRAQSSPHSGLGGGGPISPSVAPGLGWDAPDRADLRAGALWLLFGLKPVKRDEPQEAPTEAAPLSVRTPFPGTPPGANGRQLCVQEVVEPKRLVVRPDSSPPAHNPSQHQSLFQ